LKRSKGQTSIRRLALDSAQAARAALECLSRVAGAHGVDISADRLRHIHAIEGALNTALLLRVTADAGLHTRATRLDWTQLTRLGEAYPSLLRLNNGNWVVVPAADGAEAVRVIDPLAETWR
jgi:ATP-binding cassette subfamily B protein